MNSSHRRWRRQRRTKTKKKKKTIQISIIRFGRQFYCDYFNKHRGKTGERVNQSTQFDHVSISKCSKNWRILTKRKKKKIKQQQIGEKSEINWRNKKRNKKKNKTILLGIGMHTLSHTHKTHSQHNIVHKEHEEGENAIKRLCLNTQHHKKINIFTVFFFCRFSSSVSID